MHVRHVLWCERDGGRRVERRVLQVDVRLAVGGNRQLGLVEPAVAGRHIRAAAVQRDG